MVTMLPQTQITEDEIAGFDLSMQLAETYRLNERYEDAIETLKQALDVAHDDQDAEVFNKLTVICDELIKQAGEYREKAQYEDALKLLRLALKSAQEKENTALFYKLESSDGNFGLEYQEWKTGIHYEIALIYEDRNEYQRAIESYEKIQEHRIESESTPDALYNIATIYARELKEYEKGAEHYEKYLKKRKNDSDALFCLGFCHEKLGQTEDALGYYRQAIEFESNSDLIIQYAQSILNINPEDAETLYKLATVYQKLDEIDKAIQCYEQLLDIDPEHVEAYIALGNIYAESEEYKKAAKHYEKASSIKSDNNPEIAELINSLNRLIQKTPDFEEEDTISDEDNGVVAIKKPYDPSEIKVDMTPFTIFQVMRKIKLKEIKLQPDFQRHIIWDDTRQSRLIESILIRIPLPAFYLDATNDDEWMVVDGLQRLHTMDRFCNKNELKLINLEFLTELEGQTFDELPRRFQRQIEDHTRLNFYIIQPDTPSRVKFTIFYRINTGGLILTPQEIRHSLFQGKSTDLLRQLAESDTFKGATANSIKSKRMEDRECILRWLAFHIRPYTEYNTLDLHGFLCDIMQYVNRLPGGELETLKTLFRQTMHKSKAVFGDYAFRKIYQKGGQKYPINKALFEVWSVSLMTYDMNDLKNRKDEIVENFAEIMNTDAEFGKSISQGTGSANKVRKRFRTIENLLSRIMR